MNIVPNTAAARSNHHLPGLRANVKHLNSTGPVPLPEADPNLTLTPFGVVGDVDGNDLESGRGWSRPEEDPEDRDVSEAGASSCT